MEEKQQMTLEQFVDEWQNDSPTVLVHTSGSTGKPKPMLAEKRRMAESARITCDFLGLKEGDTALLCMPLDFIAGKMVVVRALTRKLSLVCVKPGGHPLKDLAEPPVFAAMVPMQVYNSLQTDKERKLLMGVKHLVIGGGPIDDALCDTLRDFPNAVWSTYGMTETLSHIALRRLNGMEASEWYTPLDNVRVRTGNDGCLVIDAPAVCPATLATNDLAEMHPDGRRFRIKGRKDNMICSGGIKMMMEEIEDAVRPYINTPFMITKRKDPRFGECVAMLIEAGNTTTAREACQKHLSKYQQPKHYISVNRLPRTATGKPARAEAQKIAAAEY